ncbi:MAG: hypothetical protein GC200_06445 [Tepidisphaera sp.]|nr:hypothetical protein [Tepidisphaera sp.]
MPDTATSPARRSARAARLAAALLGLLLLIGAAWGVARDPMSTLRFWGALLGAPWWAAALLLAGPCVNWLLTSGVFYVLTRPRVQISLGEMTALVGASWLLNFVPFSPGLLGRVEYQRRLHGLSVRTNGRIIVESIALGWASIGVALPGLLLARGEQDAGATIATACVPVLVLAGLAWVAARGGAVGRAMSLAFAMKVIDLLTWTARYVLVFHLAGVEIGWVQGLAVAVVAQTAMLVPLIGNGLGIREWAVGLLSGLLPVAATTATGLGADLMNRAGELVAALPVGLLCGVWLARLHTVRNPPDRSGVRSPIETLSEGASQGDPTTGRTRTD